MQTAISFAIKLFVGAASISASITTRGGWPRNGEPFVNKKSNSALLTVLVAASNSFLADLLTFPVFVSLIFPAKERRLTLRSSPSGIPTSASDPIERIDTDEDIIHSRPARTVTNIEHHALTYIGHCHTIAPLSLIELHTA